jgi:hypothetical protein
VSVEVDTTELRRGLDQLARGISGSTSAVAVDAASSSASRIRAAVPKRTGTAASSIHVAKRGSGDRAEAVVTAGAPYFGWLNWGGTRGRPYVAAGRYTGPATEHAAEDFYDACHAMTRREIRKL